MWTLNSDVGDIAMNSYNHYAFGAVVGPLYRRFAAIAPAAPGFAEIAVDPVFDWRIGRVYADYRSQMGHIVTEVDGDRAGLTHLRLVVPAGASARVRCPSRVTGGERGPRCLIAPT